MVQVHRCEETMNTGRLLCIFLGICGTIVNQSHSQKTSLEVIHSWSQLEFDYANEHERQADVDSRIFIPGVPAPIDVDLSYSDQRIFVTIPRFQEGIPVTLGTISNRTYNGNPVITPYPSWSWHRHPKKCSRDRIVSVYRVMIDECERLWVLDNGVYLDHLTCSPQLLAFDLRTNRLVSRYEIPSSQIESRSILVTPVVDVRGSCDNTFVYMADCQTYSIIVYDAQNLKSWRVTDKTMYPYPNYGTYTIKGDSFDLMDGILGMALTPYVPGQDRTLFYHAMSSPTENRVLTSHLRNHSMFTDEPSSSPQIFYTYRGERRTQSAAEAIDKNNVMYFGLMSDVKIACFNTKGEYGEKSSMDIVASNSVTLQFASGVKVINNKNGDQELWVLTSRFQKVSTGSIDSTEVNFRILAAKTKDLLHGTRCKGNSGPSGGHNHISGGYGRK